MSTRPTMSIKPEPVVTSSSHALQRQSAVHGVGISSWVRTLSNAVPTEQRPATTEALQRAASEPSHSVSEPLRNSLERNLGHDFSQIKVHDGPASADAAERIGARAYTLGNDIHLGTEAHGLPRQQFDRLLTHEAVHTVQQGRRTIAPHAGLAVSSPTDTGEQEAERIANSVSDQDLSRQSSRSLALRNQMRASMAGQHIAGSVSPQIQRDITGKYPASQGEFAMDLKKTQTNPGPKTGLSGTIKFKANDKAPDSASIRLLQVAKTENLATGKDLVWGGGEANRNKVMTEASPGVESGFFVDQLYKTLKPRSKKTDPAISPYYIDYGNSGPANNKDGSKKGKAISEASLWDYPGSTGNIRFSFETVAKASDTGHVYGTIMWGFAITDASKGKIEHERAVGRNVTLLSTDKAIDAFNKFFRNPGAPTAPAK
jgi:hypothetical protein